MHLRPLSPEVVVQICEYLAPDDLPSVYELALASKQSYVVASRHLFPQIYLSIASREETGQICQTME
jgi:hypothetical protein